MIIATYCGRNKHRGTASHTEVDNESAPNTLIFMVTKIFHKIRD